MILKRKPKRFKIPAEYGTVEKRVTDSNGNIVFETERVLLREAVDLPFGLQNYIRYKTVSERVLVQQAREIEGAEGEPLLVPSQYRTITKQVQDGFNVSPPKKATSLFRFFAKRDVRQRILDELRSDYQEEQLFHFGISGANLWYWKEVLFILATNLVRSDLGKAAGSAADKILPK